MNAASRLVSGERNEELDAKFANLLPVFHQLSSSSDVEALENALSAGTFAADDCTMKKDSLGFPVGGNVVFCVLAAEVPHPNAVLPAVEFWRQGSELLQANPKYAGVLFQRARKAPPDQLPPDDIFPELESKPKEYLKHAKELIAKDSFLYGKVVGERLFYLADFIIDRDFPKFAKSKNDVAWVLEYLDWNHMADESIAKLYIAMKGLPDDVKSDGVIDNFNSLKFRQPWIDTYTNWMRACRSGTHRACRSGCEAYVRTKKGNGKGH